MGKVEPVMRGEIGRLARSEIRKAERPLLKKGARLEGQIADQMKAVEALQKRVAP